MWDIGLELQLRDRQIVRCIGRPSLMGVCQNQVRDWMHRACDWVKLQVLSMYKKYLVWDMD